MKPWIFLSSKLLGSSPAWLQSSYSGSRHLKLLSEHIPPEEEEGIDEPIVLRPHGAMMGTLEHLRILTQNSDSKVVCVRVER
jgi:hypothetical protein